METLAPHEDREEEEEEEDMKKRVKNLPLLSVDFY